MKFHLVPDISLKELKCDLDPGIYRHVAPHGARAERSSLFGGVADGCRYALTITTCGWRVCRSAS
jgi:hypothetical protein